MSLDKQTADKQTAATADGDVPVRRQRWLPLVVLAAAFGCGPLDSGTDTYLSVTGDLQGPRPADWSCLGGALPPPPSSYPETVTYTFQFVEWLTGNPLPGRSIQVCNRLDPMCQSPLIAPTTIVEGQREVSVQLPAGQNVFLQLSTTDPLVVPELLYLDGPVYEDVQGGRIQMLSGPTVLSLAQTLALPFIQELAVLAIRAHDCNGTIVGGARYSINDASGKTYPFTLVNGYPVADRPPMPSVITTIPSDNSPWAGFINVPAEALSIDGILEGGREFGTADIQVRPGFLNSVEIQARNHL